MAPNEKISCVTPLQYVFNKAKGEPSYKRLNEKNFQIVVYEI